MLLSRITKWGIFKNRSTNVKIGLNLALFLGSPLIKSNGTLPLYLVGNSKTPVSLIGSLFVQQACWYLKQHQIFWKRPVSSCIERNQIVWQDFSLPRSVQRLGNREKLRESSSQNFLVQKLARSESQHSIFVGILFMSPIRFMLLQSRSSHKFSWNFGWFDKSITKQELFRTSWRTTKRKFRRT